MSLGCSFTNAISVDPQILSVGAEPLLRRLDLNGALLSQIQCAPTSAFLYPCIQQDFSVWPNNPKEVLEPEKEFKIPVSQMF
ncbi:hypothetical protein Bca4012_041892 [Brassica carinata]|uniref:Uncharacterized protein n=1 Tax=Brassica oleracea TaxID=3712 RepID=A0A3P6EC23_BRAOL|nr:unnamed protein product [Brassica oleracea]